jgi:hypothetical protein
MMKLLWRSAKKTQTGPAADHANGIDQAVSYDSVAKIRSTAIPGVTFAIYRISFGRRMELARQAREISRRAEFLDAGNQLQEKIDANILAQEVDAMYLRWALMGIQGLTIDGESPSPDQLLQKGPETLTREILGAIKQECGLNEAERKN